MRSPAYHLRPNKSAERFAFIEAIRRLGNISRLSVYTYYGLGGPYLEDFRLLYEFFPEIHMVSIEERTEVKKRQQFHLPCVKVNLVKKPMKDFITNYTLRTGQRSIFWLDYTRLELGCFTDFNTLLKKIGDNGMVKITLRAETSDFWKNPNEQKPEATESFQNEFEKFLPSPTVTPPWSYREFSILLQNMVRICSEDALPSSVNNLTFQPISSIYYSDGTGMFTLTGIVCDRNNAWRVKDAYQGWEFANTNWGEPRQIDVPILSTKERLLLQSYLPCGAPRGSKLRAVLGYLIDDDESKTDNALEQYAAFHRYVPYFMRGTP